jgi:hypothetical protein
MWTDAYIYANLVLWLGIGVWVNRESAPYFIGEALGEKLLRFCGNDKEASTMRNNAKEFSQIYYRSAGRETAAREIAILAGIGKASSSFLNRGLSFRQSWLLSHLTGRLHYSKTYEQSGYGT